MKEFTETTNPMEYDWWLTGPDGAHFELKPTAKHTQEDINEAKAFLRRNRDVVSIKITRQ